MPDDEPKQPPDDNFLAIFADLAAPFRPDQVKIRSGGSGRQMHYITARQVMNRLDDVVGPAKWWDRYSAGEHSVLCELTIELPNGKLLTKSDAGGYAGMSDPGDDDKSGHADALKRAAVKFGIGRYLYRDGIPDFVVGMLGLSREQIEPQSDQPAPSQSGRSSQQRQEGRSQPQGQRRGDGSDQGPPRNGRSLFAWVKDQDEKYDYGLLKSMNSWAKRKNYPERIVDFDAQQVATAYVAACNKIQSIQKTEPVEEAMS